MQERVVRWVGWGGVGHAEAPRAAVLLATFGGVTSAASSAAAIPPARSPLHNPVPQRDAGAGGAAERGAGAGAGAPPGGGPARCAALLPLALAPPLSVLAPSHRPIWTCCAACTPPLRTSCSGAGQRQASSAGSGMVKCGVQGGPRAVAAAAVQTRCPRPRASAACRARARRPRRGCRCMLGMLRCAMAMLRCVPRCAAPVVRPTPPVPPICRASWSWRSARWSAASSGWRQWRQRRLLSWHDSRTRRRSRAAAAAARARAPAPEWPHRTGAPAGPLRIACGRSCMHRWAVGGLLPAWRRYVRPGEGADKLPPACPAPTTHCSGSWPRACSLKSLPCGSSWSRVSAGVLAAAVVAP